MSRVALLLVAVALASCAAAAATRTVFIEGRDKPLAVKDGWRRLDTPVTAADLAAEHSIIICLWGENRDVLEKLFRERSNPKHVDYARWLTTDEITEIVAPRPEVQTKLSAFLERNHIEHSYTRNRDMIRARATYATLARVFGVKYEHFVHRSGRKALATLSPYSLPATIATHVARVSMLAELPDVHEPRARVAAPPTDIQINPSVIRARYNITVETSTSTNNSIGVAEFQAQYFKQSDLDLFFSKFVPQSTDSTVAHIIGPNAGQPGDEASLDVDYAFGLAPGANYYFYSYAQNAFWSDLTAWLAELQDETDIPFVISVSYGSQGDYPSTSYRTNQDTEYMKVGLRGTSIVYASGDSGAGCGSTCNTLQPSYPAMSEYVTAVGATAFIAGNTGPERAVSQFGSGGGFGGPSAGFTTAPSYSETFYADYLSSGVTLPNAKAYVASNRANPDVGALGSEEFVVIQGGKEIFVGGTSCSAPTFSAMIALLNDQQFARGEKSLGFLNELIYGAWAEAGVFWDVTVGNNICSGSSLFAAESQCGWDCAKGWDPVTGLGTMNFARALENLPSTRSSRK